MSWWGEKVGTTPAAPTPPPPRFDPNLMPGGTGQNHEQAMQHYLARQQQQQTAPGYTQPSPQPVQEFVPNTNDPTKVSEVLPIWQWQGNMKDGAARNNVGGCPNCGGPRYLVPRGNGTTVLNEKTGQMVAAAPSCMDCGFPREQGALGYQATVTVAGKGTAARQGAEPALIPGSQKVWSH